MRVDASEPAAASAPRLSAAVDYRWGLLLLSFFESFGTILLERGVYFYTHDERFLGLSDAQNLGLAFAFGVTYVTGALLSHAACHRVGEKRLLIGTLLALFVLHAALMLRPMSLPLLVAVYPVLGILHGAKWPIVESYVSAGRTPRQMLGVIGRFNISWALAVPLSIALVGPMIESSWPPILFAVAAAINLGVLAFVLPLPSRPEHLDLDHPERPAEDELHRYRLLLVSARWSMLGCYSLLFLVSPLMPTVFGKLGFTGTPATVAASMLDVVRLVAFAVLGVWAGWHGRPGPLVFTTLGLPLGFLMVLFGPNLATVLAGEVLFGAAAGMCYFAALYYALIVKNASVDAGGAHEGLIGLGFALGPLLGLMGHAFAWAFDTTGSAAHDSNAYTLGMMLGIAPLLLFTILGSLRPLPRLRQFARHGDDPFAQAQP